MITVEYRKQICDLGSQALPLPEFLQKVSQIASELSNAVEGIYCGREGRCREEILGSDRFLCFGWYTQENGVCRVEFAYIS